MNDYDVGQIMQEMEIELIQSMRRNLGRHMKWEEDEGFHWEQWQAKKIREIRKYRAKNMEIMANYSQKLDKGTKNDLRRQYLEGGRKVDKEVSRVIKKGFSLYRATPSNDFFQGDNEKLDRLINAIRNDMKQAQNAALRQMDDVYRKIIFKAEMFLGSGTTTLEKAIDMATKDFLKAGINCITYANGAHVNIASYTRMAVRTANKRVFLMGEGERRKEWGLSLVLVSQYSQCSPLCLPWQGRVFIDDVYSGGKVEDGDYPLLSQAIARNLFHPNCKHTMSTFFESINDVPEPMLESETGDEYKKAQRDAEINRNIQKYTRLKEGSLDPQNIATYGAKLNEWKEKARDSEGQYYMDKISASINTANEVATDAIAKSYEERRIANSLTLTPADEIKGTSSLGADFTGMDSQLASDAANQFAALSQKYSTSCNRIEVGNLEGAISAPAGTTMNAATASSTITFNKSVVNDYDKYMDRMKKAVDNGQFPEIPESEYGKYVVTHEFAHALMETEGKLKNYVALDTSDISAARKDILSLHKQYKEEMSNLELQFRSAEKKAMETFDQVDWDRSIEVQKQIDALKISKYADMSADEFMAEAFAEAELSPTPSEYAVKVHEVLKKHFGR